MEVKKMKTETILNNLLKVKDNPLKYMDVLENTINELKIDIYNENMGLKNRKQDPQKKALKFLMIIKNVFLAVEVAWPMLAKLL